MNRLIVGCGYLGQRVARLWQAAGHDVHVLTRSAERAAAFERDGLRPIIGDVTRVETLLALPAAEAVLYAVGMDRSAGLSMRTVYVEGLKNVLHALPSATGRMIYISSTGVYGSAEGEWVNEDSPCQPQRENGRVCLEAEQTLAAHPLGERAIVLRLAGIYGPQRIPRQAALQAGEPIDAPEAGYLNLIHVDDAARVVLAAEARARPPCRYVVSDGRPPVRRDYYAELARLLHAPPPRFVPPPSGSSSADRAAADKRIDSRRMFDELGVTLLHPDYRAGLAAIVAG